jgi:ABC-type nitrate/sulfonate/bicarbonate transport system permease component
MRLVKALAVPALLLAMLEIWARTVGQGSDALAPPSAALVAFFGTLRDGSLFAATGFTLVSAGAGLLLGGTAGILMGTILGLSQRAAQAGFATIELLRPIPSVALIPLALLVFGFGFRMEISVIAFATFWPILILTQAAVRQVEPVQIEMAQALELGRTKTFFSVVLPSIAPRLFVGVRLGIAISLVVAITIEIAANPHGVGYALILAQQSLEPALMLAWLAWIGVLGFGFNALATVLETRLGDRLAGRR